jgi:hypothetical protein
MSLKFILKRGALLTAANWPVVAIQFVASVSFQVLLAVPIIGAAILVAVLLGADLFELLQGSLYNIFTTVASTLISDPAALVIFVSTFLIVLLGGSVLMFLVKGGTVDVLVAAHRAAGAIERQAITAAILDGASQFTMPRFWRGCRRLFRPYVYAGLGLMAIYAASCGVYIAFAYYAYQAATDRLLIVGWSFAAAFGLVLLVAWITIVNILYLLTQIAIAVDDAGGVDAIAHVARFIRAEFRALAGIFGIVIALVAIAVAVSALVWSGLGLVAFVPLVGLAVFPLQVIAWLVRGLVFEYLALTALAAYVSLYMDHAARRSGAGDRLHLARVLDRSA